MDRKVFNARQLAELIRHIVQGELPFALVYAEPDPVADDPDQVRVKLMASDYELLPSFADVLQAIYTKAKLPEGMNDNGYRSN